MRSVALILSLFFAVSAAFSPTIQVGKNSATRLEATNEDFFENLSKKTTVAAAGLMTAISASPLAALADEEYEYGAVDAPIGIAWAGGALAILTALLPVVLQGGEEAFEEMKERDSDKWAK